MKEFIVRATLPDGPVYLSVHEPTAVEAIQATIEWFGDPNCSPKAFDQSNDRDVYELGVMVTMDLTTRKGEYGTGYMIWTPVMP